MIRSPKIYVRDSGIVHALLGIVTHDDLLSHPVAGTSWEGWVIENLLAAAPAGAAAYFYRTAAGAEIDLVLEFRPGHLWAIECKRSLTPTPPRGFHEGCKDLQPQQKLVIYPGLESFPLGQGVECLSLPEPGPDSFRTARSQGSLSERRPEVWPIATILTADADTEGINSTIRRLRRSAE